MSNSTGRVICFGTGGVTALHSVTFPRLTEAAQHLSIRIDFIDIINARESFGFGKLDF
jgi:hypothetical protein